MRRVLPPKRRSPIKETPHGPFSRLCGRLAEIRELRSTLDARESELRALTRSGESATQQLDVLRKDIAAMIGAPDPVFVARLACLRLLRCWSFLFGFAGFVDSLSVCAVLDFSSVRCCCCPRVTASRSLR